MSAAEQKIFASFEEYLLEEKKSDVRLELISGVIIAMAGASKNHNLMTTNTVVILANHLHNSPCEVLASDMKLKVNHQNNYYPDVGVYCEQEDQDQYIKKSPLLIIEVLSQSTMATDLTTKRENYFNIPSLDEYIVLFQNQIKAIVFKRVDKTSDWTKKILQQDDVLLLHSINLEIPLTNFYHKVTL